MRHGGLVKRHGACERTVSRALAATAAHSSMRAFRPLPETMVGSLPTGRSKALLLIRSPAPKPCLPPSR